MDTESPRQVVAMSTRKIHAATCRYVEAPGSWQFPYADKNAIALLPHCRACSPAA